MNDLIIVPIQAASYAFAVSTLVQTTSNDHRFPIWAADPSASFVAEGAEIPVTDADVDELIVTPKKVAGLSVVSRELAEDAAENTDAAEQVGNGLARAIARKVDAAFFGTHTTNGPDGLRALSGVTEVEATGGIADLDWAAEAISEATNVGAQLTASCVSPAVGLALAQLKTFDSVGSNVPLLQPDPILPTRKLIQGVRWSSCPAARSATM